jgi:hypothetical protein
VQVIIQSDPQEFSLRGDIFDLRALLKKLQEPTPVNRMTSLVPARDGGRDYGGTA